MSSCRAAPSLNDAVLRAFERELGAAGAAARPSPGLMGAYGAALLRHAARHLSSAA